MKKSIRFTISLLSVFKYLFLFIVGGFAYFYMEILYRGFSHFSMIVCGGLAFIFCGLLNQNTHYQLTIPIQMIFSCFIITTLEFITGYIVNIRLHWNIWDYSSLPYNLYGQICLTYSLIWFILSLLCIFADDWIRWIIFEEAKPHYKWF